jgi:hypothetical protein
MVRGIGLSGDQTDTHADDAKRHRHSGSPAEPIEPAFDDETAHDLLFPDEEHEDDHDRRGQDAIDDSAPVKRLDWIDRCKIECDTQKARECKYHVKRDRRFRFAREPDGPFTAFGHSVCRRARKHRNSQKAGAYMPSAKISSAKSPAKGASASAACDEL